MGRKLVGLDIIQLRVSAETFRQLKLSADAREVSVPEEVRNRLEVFEESGPLLRAMAAKRKAELDLMMANEAISILERPAVKL